jgi:hypothetical protein
MRSRLSAWRGRVLWGYAFGLNDAVVTLPASRLKASERTPLSLTLQKECRAQSIEPQLESKFVRAPLISRGYPPDCRAMTDLNAFAVPGWRIKALIDEIHGWSRVVARKFACEELSRMSIQSGARIVVCVNPGARQIVKIRIEAKTSTPNDIVDEGLERVSFTGVRRVVNDRMEEYLVRRERRLEKSHQIWIGAGKIEAKLGAVACERPPLGATDKNDVAWQAPRKKTQAPFDGEERWSKPGMARRKFPEMQATYSPELGLAALANSETAHEFAFRLPREKA